MPKVRPIDATTQITEIPPVGELYPVPKLWVIEPQPWPGGITSDADPLLMLVDLFIGAIRQHASQDKSGCRDSIIWIKLVQEIMVGICA